MCLLSAGHYRLTKILWWIYVMYWSENDWWNIYSTWAMIIQGSVTASSMFKIGSSHWKILQISAHGNLLVSISPVTAWIHVRILNQTDYSKDNFKNQVLKQRTQWMSHWYQKQSKSFIPVLPPKSARNSPVAGPVRFSWFSLRWVLTQLE